MKKNEKLFVGGYFDSRIFKGEQFEGKTPFNKDVDVYSLEEALNLGFVGDGFKEYYSEVKGKEWDIATDDEKTKALIDYVEFDEVASLAKFDTEEDALKYKNEIIKEVEDVEQHSEYVGKEQDSEGYYREVYIAIKED